MADEQVIDNTPTTPNVMSSITADGVTVDSNFETPDELRTSLGIEEAPTEPTRRRRNNRHENPTVAVSEAKGRAKEAERLAAEAAGKAAALEAEIAELKKPKPAPVAAAPPPPVTAPASQQAPPAQTTQAPPTTAEYKRFMAMPDAPKPEQFPGENGWQDYQYAVNIFVADKRFDERMAATQHAQQVAQHQTKFTTRIQAEVAKDATFQQKLDQTPVDTRIVPYLHQHPQGDEIMVHLVNNPAIAQELTTLPPINQIGRIGELVAELKAQSAAALPPASARPAISQANPPTKRVSGAPPVAVSDEIPGDGSSEAEHEAWRRAHPREGRRRYR